MPYSITTKDGITINNIPDEIPQDSPELKARVAKLRGGEVAKPEPEESFPQKLGRGVLNAGAGAIRGAGSIGATLLAPRDALESFIARTMGAPEMQAPERRKAMDGALQGMGADTDSLAFGAGKLGGEIAGTLGAGGAVANGLSRIPGAASAMPNVLNAIRTSGMTGGGMPARMAGGAVTGGVSAGLVNPEDAALGAGLGGALPVITKVAGHAGRLLGSTPKNPLTPQALQTARESMDAGYVIPPSMVNPSFGNRTLETISGKHATAQLASTKNQAITEGLVRKGLGLADDAPLSFDTMRAYRGAQHSAGYEPLRQVGTIPAGASFNSALDDIAKAYTGKGTIPAIEKKNITELVNAHKSAGFDSGDAVDAIRILREDASDAFRRGDGALGKANKAIADAYESAIDDALTASGQGDLLNAYRAARQNIAKSATVEKAIREGSGTLDARILARELQKGKPLSGDIKTVAQFANVFDKAAQPPHLIGSPDVHNLRAFASSALTGGGALAAGPVGMMAGAAPYVLPPLARARMFSKGAQQGLLNQGGQGLLGGSLDELLPLLYRTNPVLSGGLIGGQ